jgi:tRNA(Ile)-lysidine synthase
MAKSKTNKTDIVEKVSDESPASTNENSETKIDGFKVQRKKSNTRRKAISSPEAELVIVDEKKALGHNEKLKKVDDTKVEESKVESDDTNTKNVSKTSAQKRKSTKAISKKDAKSESEVIAPKIESLNFGSIITFDSDDDLKVSDKIVPESKTSTPHQAKVNPNQNIQGRNRQHTPNQQKPNPNQQKPNQIKHNPNQQKQNPNQIKINPNQIKQNPNQIKQNPNQQKQNPNQIKINPNQKPEVEDFVVNAEQRAKVEQPKQNPNQIKQNPNQQKQNPNQIKQNPNQQKQNPNQIKINPNQKPEVEDFVINAEQRAKVEQQKQNPNQIKQNPNKKPEVEDFVVNAEQRAKVEQPKQNPNQIKKNPNQIKQNPNQIKQNPNQIKQNPNQIKQNPNQIKKNPNQIKQNPNQKPEVDDFVVNSEQQEKVEQQKQNPNQIKQNPNQIKQNPNQKPEVDDFVVNTEQRAKVEQPKQNPNQIKQNPNQQKQNPNQIKKNPNQKPEVEDLVVNAEQRAKVEQPKQNPNQIKQNPNQKAKSEQTKQKPQAKNAKSKNEGDKQDLQAKQTPKPIAREVLTYTLPDVKQLAPRLLKNPVIRKFLVAIEDFLKTRIYIEKGFRIVLAVSGGVDSVVMLDCMALIADKLGLQIYIAHFNHMLREKESDLDVELVKNLADQYNLQFLHSSGNVKAFSQKNNISIEHAARTLRYNFFERTTRNLDADLMATAHTSDDSVETFILNLLRGSGLTGLSGIPEVRKFVKNVLIIRPLLAFSKKEIKNYAELRKLKWREDESNQLLNYTRNKIRLDLMPKLRADYNPAVDDIITRTARLIYGADNLIKELVKKHLVPVVVDVTPERFSLKVPILQTHEEFMQGEIIQAAWLKYFRLQPLSLSAVDRIMSIFDKQSGTQVEIGSGYFALKDRNIVIISKSSIIKKIKVFGSVPSEYRVNGYKIVFTLVDKRAVKIIENPEIEYFDFDKVGTYVEIRNWEHGDTFQPLGAPGDMKISDFLTNEKVSLLEKPNIITVRNTYETVWVVGKRIGEKFKIDSETKKFLKAEIVQLK